MQKKKNSTFCCVGNEASANLQHVEVFKGNNIQLLGTDALEIIIFLLP